MEINDEESSQGLRVCKPESRLGNTQSVLEKRGEPRVLLVRRALLRRLRPACLASGLAPEGCPSEAGSLDDGCRVV